MSSQTPPPYLCVFGTSSTCHVHYSIHTTNPIVHLRSNRERVITSLHTVGSYRNTFLLKTRVWPPVYKRCGFEISLHQQDFKVAHRCDLHCRFHCDFIQKKCMQVTMKLAKSNAGNFFQSCSYLNRSIGDSGVWLVMEFGTESHQCEQGLSVTLKVIEQVSVLLETSIDTCTDVFQVAPPPRIQTETQLWNLARSDQVVQFRCERGTRPSIWSL